METRLKTFTVSIPEGKRAVWNEQGILQLVDEEKANESKDVTERIKTFCDALSELEQRAGRGDCDARQLIKEYNSVNTETSDDIVAYLQLRIITAALNEGWEPQSREGEGPWMPFFHLYTRKDIDAMCDDEKDKNELLLWGSSANGETYCGCVCDIDGYPWNYASAACGYRLVFKTDELAEYAGRQFASIWARFYIGDKAKGLKPWREVEGKEEPADEEEES